MSEINLPPLCPGCAGPTELPGDAVIVAPTRITTEHPDEVKVIHAPTCQEVQK